MTVRTEGRAPTNLTLTASAQSTTGALSKVEFHQGATKLGEDAAAPYALTWSNVAAGLYTLTAVILLALFWSWANLRGLHLRRATRPQRGQIYTSKRSLFMKSSVMSENKPPPGPSWNSLLPA